MENVKSALIFASGKVVFTGAKTKDDIDKAYYELKRKMEKFKKNWFLYAFFKENQHFSHLINIIASYSWPQLEPSAEPFSPKNPQWNLDNVPAKLWTLLRSSLAWSHCLGWPTPLPSAFPLLLPFLSSALRLLSRAGLRTGRVHSIWWPHRGWSPDRSHLTFWCLGFVVCRTFWTAGNLWWGFWGAGRWIILPKCRSWRPSSATSPGSTSFLLVLSCPVFSRQSNTLLSADPTRPIPS